MNEKMRESLSAMMDNEANELEIERVLSQAGENGELRSAWVRYNMVRHSVQGDRLMHAQWDVSTRVRQAIAQEEGGASNASTNTGPTLRQRVARPIASLAVAASVAATVVIGGQQLAQLGGTGPGVGSTVAHKPSPVGFINTPGATAIPASYGLQGPVLQPATRTAYDELARNRSGKYMQEHAEQAALNSPQGLLPYARVPDIRR